MPSDLQMRHLPPEMEELLRAFSNVAPPEEAGRLLANSSNRSIALLYKLARDQAVAHKGTKDWSTWAKLANAARTAVLAASMCREIANGMARDHLTESTTVTPNTSSETNPAIKVVSVSTQADEGPDSASHSSSERMDN